jgi:hypothetical protein
MHGLQTGLFCRLKNVPEYYTIVLKSQHYNTPAAACFGPHWYIVREHTIVKNICLIFSAYNRAVENSSLCNIYVVDRVKYYSGTHNTSCSNYYFQSTTRSTIYTGHFIMLCMITNNYNVLCTSHRTSHHCHVTSLT